MYADSKGGGNQRCWGYEVCARVDTYVGKSHGTYLHINDGARVPKIEVLIERIRTDEHFLQQHTVHERARERNLACEHMP